MRAIPNRKAQQLLLHGARALSVAEANGIRIDEGYLAATIKSTEKDLEDRLKRLADSRIGKRWRKRFPENFNLLSTKQLAKVLTVDLGLELPTTEKGNARTDESVLVEVDDPFVQDYLAYKHLSKALKTYLLGIQREVADGYLHPFFNLHTVATYRSSSDRINFQNQPKRDEEIATLVRRCFIPRPGHVLLEGDYSGLEVCISACYNRDPKLIRYIKDPNSDMHRDMASQIFMLPPSKVTKAIRFDAKSFFVFAQFYGDWYKACAKNLWHRADKLVLEDGTPMKEHLRSKNLRKCGACDPQAQPSRNSFEHHLMEVEDDFWHNRFKVYDDWRRAWYKEYLRNGFIKMLTGFICRGPMARKDTINYPIQGSAFHCLLRSFAHFVLNEIPKKKLKGLVVGQIHDSIVSDVPESEVEDYRAVMHDVMVRQLMEKWSWIIVPLAVEFDMYPESWARAA